MGKYVREKTDFPSRQVEVVLIFFWDNTASFKVLFRGKQEEIKWQRHKP